MANKSMINQLGKRTAMSGSNQYEYFPIGPDVKQVGAQRNSNNNNLEEQLILGTDSSDLVTYAEFVDSSTGETKLRKTERISFKTNTSSTDYYILDRVQEMELPLNYNQNRKKLTLNLDPEISRHEENLSFKSSKTNPQNQDVNVSGKNTSYNYSGNNVTITSSITSRY